MATYSKTTKQYPMHNMYIGFVKQVVDKKRAGRLRVWIPEFASSEHDENGWVLCTYCSPFAGATSWTGNQKDPTQFQNTQLSYGFWAVPPDLNNEVLVIFPQNDVGQALWIGCLYKEYMNSMVPGVPSHTKNHQNGKNIPTAEYNKMDKKVTTPVDPYKRPWHKTKVEGVGNQGLINDNVRGTNSSSPNRDDISQVVGILTPGPNDPDPNRKDTRLGGHSFVMDDGEDSEYIALVTRSGAQIRIDETNELVYIINKPGTAWVQLDAEGNVDVFSAKSMSIRSQESINMRADKDINIEAGQNINMKAAKDTNADGSIVGEDAGDGGNITFQALNDMHATVKNNTFLTVSDGSLDVVVQTGNTKVDIAGNLDVKVGGNGQETYGGTLGIKSTNYNLDSSGNVKTNGNSIAGGKMFAQDFKSPSHGLNDHQHLYTPPVHAKPPTSTTKDGGGGGSSSASGPDAPAGTPAITKSPVTKTNILVDFPSGGGDIQLDYWNREKEDIQTTVDRFMTYEPCPEHKNKGDS